MNPIEEKKKEIRARLDGAVSSLYGLSCEYSLTRPSLPSHGELTAAAPLVLGGLLKRPPVEIGREIVGELRLAEGERAEVAGKGFLNFFLGSGFLLSALDSSPRFGVPPLPDLADPRFFEVYPAVRLAAVLETQGVEPDGSERLELLTAPEERRLLWAVFGGDKRELAQAALSFYDRLGLKSGFAPLDMARCVLLKNAVWALCEMEV